MGEKGGRERRKRRRKELESHSYLPHAQLLYAHPPASHPPSTFSYLPYSKSFLPSLLLLPSPSPKRARVKKKTFPWITSDIRALMRARNYFRTKAKKSKRAEDWEHFKKLRNHVTWCQRRAKRHYFEDLSVQSAGNPRKAWKEINRLLGTGYRREVDSLKVGAGVITDKQDIAEEFGSFFSSVVGTIGEDLDGVDPCEMVPVCEL